MNEKQNKPVESGENLPVPPEQYLPTLEQQKSLEQQEQTVGRERQRELQKNRQEQPAQFTPASTPAAGGVDRQAASDDNSTADSNMPAYANDVDVIEKEWVNKAKQIIKDNHDNPYEQERAVEQLQIEYLKKRYGRDVKPSR